MDSSSQLTIAYDMLEPGRKTCPFSSASWLNFSIIFGLSDTDSQIFLQFLQ